MTMKPFEFDPQYNITPEFFDCLNDLYDILEALEAIKRKLFHRVEINQILNPPFDSFRTIGKY